MPEHIPIAEAEHIAERYGFSQVFIFARQTASGVEHLVTYGTDMENSTAAATIGIFLKEKIMGWPAGDDAEVGERVALARQAPELKRQRDRLRAVLRPIFAEIDSDPMAVQFFDLRLITEARAAIAECAASDDD